jgi:hypothetical protein
MSTGKTPEQVVQEQLDFYNNQDVPGFASTYSEDVQLIDHPSGKVFVSGQEELKERYAKMFLANPENHAALKNRIVFGDFVIDLEEVSGRDNREPFQAVAIYQVKESLISKVWFLEK